MEIIKVQDSDLQGAMDVVRQKYGADALILEIRKKRKFLLGPTYYELLVGLDKDRSQDVPTVEQIRTLERVIKKLDSTVNALAAKEDRLDSLTRQTGFSKEFLVKAGVTTDEEWVPKLREYLGSKLSFARLEELGFPSFPKVFVFVGPTGVGKTTTIAKLSGYLLLEKNVKSGIVTIDTFRAGAVEQIKLFGKAMNVPVEVVRRPHQMNRVLPRFLDAYYVFVDTVGRNPKELGKLSEMRMFVDQLAYYEPVFCLSASMRKDEMIRAYEHFSKVFALKYFVLTKVDEAESLGTALEFMAETGLTTLAFTNGQSVPDDLVFPNKEQVMDLMGLLR
ncbi:flagellar GTP-binding protein [Coprothermobacteraceae bacterium]|nr:flagellar GTP-binding protein [Coprothermobacteraceae bacterium]